MTSTGKYRRTSAALALVIAATVPACGGGSGSAPTGPAPVPASAPGVAVPNEGWTHVAEGSAITYRNNPPASGPHYPVWLRWQEYSAPMARGYWVHNLEHGGIVVVYRPDAPADVIARLTDAFRGIPVDPACGHPRSLLTPDPLLPRLTAAIAADFVLLSDTVDPQAIRDFALALRNHGPEQVCEGGSRP